MCLSIFGFTQGSEVVPTQEKMEAMKASKTYDVSNLTTRESRAMTKFQITTGFGGDTGGMGGHLTFGTLVKRDLILEARVAFPVGVQDDKSSFIFTSIGAKLFTGNSFFIKPALYYAGGDEYSDNFTKASAGGFMFTIGNEWRINKNIVIGADWIGYGVNLIEFEGEPAGENLRVLVFNIGYAF